MKINISRISGKFTAPLAGVYLVTFSYQATNDPEERTYAYLYKDGIRLKETQHHDFLSGSGPYAHVQSSTSGRAVYQYLEAGSTIHLQADYVNGGGMLNAIFGESRWVGDMSNIILCVEFVNN